ncbi:DEAD/DEAH box helicase [Marinilabiliaceae bacterium ANBcel2]|nr:DEAD/DEAH box helicase [Marinilabiliaceae bacterium ANBcel2]
MLSLIQTEELKNAVVEYLKATFNFDDKHVEQAFEDFLFHKRKGMFKGPYIQIRLPYQKLEKDILLSDILDVYPNFTPYIHQYIAFQRLTTQNNEPKPLILTTGTGSGKTESFLFPLLDYCYKRRDTPGIKVIILYPMNALATDQARRLAKEIYNFQDANGEYILRGKIRAGLFIGEGKGKSGERPVQMEEERIIEDRSVILKSPPDILLTNFKMLDFALMKAGYNGIWSHNYKDNTLLKFIVLDELHTYDGAKGSDVANLMRRLKLKLNISDNALVPVGTSATMGGGEEGKAELVSFFADIFGIEKDPDAVIEEQREDPEFFFDAVTEIPTVNLDAIEDCRFRADDDYATYLYRQLQFWSIPEEHNELLERLRKNQWLLELALLCGKGVMEVEDVCSLWLKRCSLDKLISLEQSILLLKSLTAILSYAKDQSSGRNFPFVYFQTTYWVRSLFRVLKKLQPNPVFLWETDIDPQDETLALPPYFCRECGGSGWIMVKLENDTVVEDLSKIRSQFMADRGNKNVYFLSSLEGKNFEDVFAADYKHSGDPIDGYINPRTLQIHDKKEKDCFFRVFGVRRQNDTRIDKVCPHCNERDTLALVGTGVPTLESVMTAQIMATASDPAKDHERKLLAFTNGVQDAAHQAGFIENRNFRFSMRHAIQSVLVDIEENITLPGFYKSFEKYWQEKLKNNPDPDAYILKFLPPDAENRVNLNKLKRDDKYRALLLKELSNRISWEIWSEFTFSAGIGRTLEKSGASAVEFSRDILADVYAQLSHWMKSNNLADRIDQNSFEKFILGFLHRLRFKGGVDHLYLRKYRTEKTNYYLITQNVNKSFFLMKNFGKNSRLPKFATLDTVKYANAFEIIKTPPKSHNWFSTYFLKCFAMVQPEEFELINDFYGQLLSYLEANDMLDKKVATGINNTGIRPEQIILTTNVSSFICKVCGHVVNVGAGNAPVLENMACLQYRCTGTYTSQELKEFDYYRMVYNRGRAVRIFAKDHTGLIDRDKREAIERDFKKRPFYNSTNVLVATSTLEMGIDIGDLNIALNSSIPPETANYLQRVGRAGRDSGTSLIVNMAGRDEHDQFFFEDTMAMMQGEVRTPACFLGAKDILRRHLMAYCFDRWAQENPDTNVIPPIVRLLGLKGLPVGDARFVFNRISDFIDKNKINLLDSFRSRFTEEEPLTALTEIEGEMHTGYFNESLKNIHQNLLLEINYYQEKQKEIKERLKTLPQSSDEAKTLKQEIKSVSTAIKAINSRDTVEYLTNLGVLPNYAFPETGISLKAQIYSKVEEDGEAVYKNEDFGEIVRSASGGLTELAPGNIFYTQGYKLQSHGIEVFSDDSYEMWRFCSNCDEMQLEANIPHGQMNCPKCQHNSWGSGSNRKTLIKFKGAISVNEKNQAKINDASDDRERNFYTKSLHLKTKSNTSAGAKILKRIPFGIEYFKSVDYYEVNTGVRDESSWATQNILINEKENPEVGFVVCKYCGKATEKPITHKELDQRKKSYHFGYCRNKGINYRHDDDSAMEVFREVYLYRSFKTEAIKILLPVQEFRLAERVAVFKSGLMLGLKSFYKGHPDHINIREYDEHNMESGKKEKFLVMYETIPGGTGYLSRLFNTDEFTRLLQEAYERILHCSCKDEGRDGCYKCIYTYGNQYERQSLSRHEAELLFQEIVEKSTEWNEVSSLSNLTRLANQEESELEEKFVNLLRETFNKNLESNAFRESIDNGKRRYRLTLGNETNSICYEIWPQNLGNSFLPGISYTTRPDFVFKCIARTENSVALDFDKCQEIKDVIVYLDGYAFHAADPHKRVLSDLKIRDEIIRNERYHVWVFTWDDIVERGNLRVNDQLQLSLGLDNVKRIALKHPLLKDFDFTHIDNNVNNYQRFISFLSSPIQKVDIKRWSSISLFACQETLLEIGIEPDMVEGVLNSGNLSDYAFSTGSVNHFSLLQKLKFTDELGFLALSHPKTLETKAAVFHKNPAGSYEKENWEFFWQSYNLIQFHDYRGIERETMIDTRSQILENFRDELHSIVNQLLEKKIEINKEYDFDLLDEGVIIAQAELGSHTSKFFMCPFDEESERKFLERGFTQFTIETFNLKNIEI